MVRRRSVATGGLAAASQANAILLVPPLVFPALPPSAVLPPLAMLLPPLPTAPTPPLAWVPQPAARQTRTKRRVRPAIVRFYEPRTRVNGPSKRTASVSSEYNPPVLQCYYNLRMMSGHF